MAAVSAGSRYASVCRLWNNSHISSRASDVLPPPRRALWPPSAPAAGTPTSAGEKMHRVYDHGTRSLPYSIAGSLLQCHIAGHCRFGSAGSPSMTPLLRHATPGGIAGTQTYLAGAGVALHGDVAALQHLWDGGRLHRRRLNDVLPPQLRLRRHVDDVLSSAKSKASR